MANIRGGLSPSEYDGRDLMWSGVGGTSSSVQLFKPMIRDQGNQVDCCTSMAIANAFEIIDHQDGHGSRLAALFHYFYSRRDPRYLGPVSLRRAFKSAAKYGFCRNQFHDYTVTPTGALRKPTTQAIEDAKSRRLVAYDPNSGAAGYYTLDGRDRVDRWRQVLSTGLPVVMGFWTQSSYWLGRGLPVPSAEPGQTAHAVCVVGYDDDRQVFNVRDSRGTQFANQGEWDLDYRVAESRQIIESWTLKTLTYND